ncbi:unnamed protein product [Gongylonema pulchrum]|uniref:Uncharacterized protein n=1 Tax=Gongylonema pulchrum TaxID=637853 RepID=A0A183ECJ4_9BILA|nr:unnamed protein product [Gongylonema pulchrum]
MNPVVVEAWDTDAVPLLEVTVSLDFSMLLTRHCLREIPAQTFDYYTVPSYWHSAECRSRSVEASKFSADCNDIMSSVYPSGRRFATLQSFVPETDVRGIGDLKKEEGPAVGEYHHRLFQQHRSLDGMQSDEYRPSDIPTHLPLDISTTGVTPSQYVGASLSNPTTTNAYFWKQPTRYFFSRGQRLLRLITPDIRV